MLRNEKGFTLIELIIIIVIIGILAAVAVPKYLDLTTSASQATARGVLGGLRSANSLVFASRVIGLSATAYDWTTIVDNAQIQGVSTGGPNATYFTITAGGVAYSFSLSPVGPAAPTTPGTIYCVGNTTW